MYRTCINALWAGCQNALQLWRELRARGYTGSAGRRKPYVALLRQVPNDLLPAAFSRKATHDLEHVFSVRRLIWLALSHPEKHSPEQAQELSRACLLHPEIATALNLTQDFVRMLRERKVDALPIWLAEAQASSIRELRQFAKSALSGIERLWKRLSPARKGMVRRKGRSPS